MKILTVYIKLSHCSDEREEIRGEIWSNVSLNLYCTSIMWRAVACHMNENAYLIICNNNNIFPVT